MSPILDSPSRSQTAEMSDRSVSPPEHRVAVPLLGSQETELKGLLSRLKAGARRWAVPSVLLNLILLPIIILIALPAKQREPCPAIPACPVAACPDGWVGYLGKCYYFSKAEANWPSSQSNCSAFGASLAAVDTQQELDFMMRYKGPSDYWIGLHKELGQPWKWTNGTEFNNWFNILGGEKCAFMNQGDIGSSRCSREGPWICTKRAEKMEDKVKWL